MNKNLYQSEKYEECSHPTLHYFDSANGISYASGFIFYFKVPYFKLHSYRIHSASIITTGATSNVYYLLSSLPSSQYSCTRNGEPCPIIAYIPNPSTGTIVSTGLFSPDYPCLPMPDITMRDISFTLRDENFNVIQNVRFIVAIEFNIIS